MTHNLYRNQTLIATANRPMCLAWFERIRSIAQAEGHPVTFSGSNKAICLTVGNNTYLAAEVR